MRGCSDINPDGSRDKDGKNLENYIPICENVRGPASEADANMRVLENEKSTNVQADKEGGRNEKANYPQNIFQPDQHDNGIFVPSIEGGNLAEGV